MVQCVDLQKALSELFQQVFNWIEDALVPLKQMIDFVVMQGDVFDPVSASVTFRLGFIAFD